MKVNVIARSGRGIGNWFVSIWKPKNVLFRYLLCGIFFFLKFLMLLLSKKINGIGTDLVGSCVAHWRLNFT